MQGSSRGECTHVMQDVNMEGKCTHVMGDVNEHGHELYNAVRYNVGHSQDVILLFLTNI